MAVQRRVILIFHIAAFPLFLGDAAPFPSTQQRLCRLVGWFPFLFTQSPSCSNSVGLIWGLLFGGFPFFIHLPFWSGTVLKRQLDIFGFFFVVVHRDCSWEYGQMKTITLFLQRGKMSPSERKPKIQIYATETFPQGHFCNSHCLRGVFDSARRLYIVQYWKVVYCTIPEGCTVAQY